MSIRKLQVEVRYDGDENLASILENVGERVEDGEATGEVTLDSGTVQWDLLEAVPA